MVDGSGQVRRPVCVYVYSEHTYISFRESEAKKKGKRCENCDKWGECEHAASLSFPGILFLLPSFFISGKDWIFCTWRNIPRASGQEAVGLHLFWNMAHGPGSSLFRGELFYSYLPPRNKWVSLRDDKLSSSYGLMRVFDFLGFSLLQVGVHFWWRFSKNLYHFKQDHSFSYERLVGWQFSVTSWKTKFDLISFLSG